MQFEGNISDWGESEIRRLGKAILTQAFKDAGRNCGERWAAIDWLKGGEAAAWAAALGLRIHQKDINAWINAGCPLEGINQK